MGVAVEEVAQTASMILDSNIVIGYLNGDESIRSVLHVWREAGTVLFISHISVVEALSSPALFHDDIVRVERFLSDFIIIPLDMDISRRAAALRRSHKLGVPDAIIVASALANHLPLATRDKKIRSIPNIVFADI